MHPALLPQDIDPTPAELIAARPQLSMHAMDGLMLEGVPLNAIADALGTPTWVTSAGTFRDRLTQLQSAFQDLPLSIHYAVKANDHLALLRIVQRAGAGADVVSGGEILRAVTAGIDPAQIVFAGVGKAEWELRLALEHGVGQFNVESAEELAMLSANAHGMGRTAKVALRINPDVDAGTHPKITTGLADNKFGIAYTDVAALYAHAATLPGLQPVGISLHIGSQILALAPFRAAYTRAAELVRTLRAMGQTVTMVDCGGGLGIAYRDELVPLASALAAVIRQTLGGLDVRLAIEPGRWLAGPSGLLLTSVVLIKHAARRFVVLDAAMNDLIRPAMYESWHGIVPVGAADAVAAPIPPISWVPCAKAGTFLREDAPCRHFGPVRAWRSWIQVHMVQS